MDWIHYIMGPLVGAFIGWLTNGIAIKMLFRPLTPKYIGKWIPKERDRIARSVGTVAESLVDEPALRRTLLSEEMLDKIRAGVRSFVNAQTCNTATIREVISGYVSADSLSRLVEHTRSTLADMVYQRVSDTAFCRGVTMEIIDHINERLRSVAGIGKVLAAFGNATRGAVATAVTKSVTPILKSSSRDIVYRVSGSEIDSLLDMSVNTMIERFGGSPDRIADKVTEIYVSTVSSKLPAVLAEINIAGIVERSLSEMDIADVEKMLLQVMHKELRAIVMLGALLGFLMGIINSFF